MVTLAKCGITKALADETKSWLLDWFNIPSAQSEDRVTVMTLSSIIEQSTTIDVVPGLGYCYGKYFSGWSRYWYHEHDVTNVSERIREIGPENGSLARASDITKQFLKNLSSICIIGGVTGIALGLRRSVWGWLACLAA